jgi:hypothetical protein
MRQGLFGEQFKRRVIVHIAVADNAAMAMARVFAQTNIRDNHEFGKSILQSPDRRLNSFSIIVRRRTDLVLLPGKPNKMTAGMPSRQPPAHAAPPDRPTPENSPASIDGSADPVPFVTKRG